VEEFYDVYRPLLGAFWPDGIWLDGVGDGGRELVKWKGPSAGQSTMFVVFDLFLGIVHGQETASRHFQEEMLQYMPPKHVNFVQDFRANFAEDALTPRSYALQCGGAMQDAYQACITQLQELRKYHLGVATKYLVRTKYGTGTSTFRTLLKETLDHTSRAQPAASNNPA